MRCRGYLFDYPRMNTTSDAHSPRVSSHAGLTFRQSVVKVGKRCPVKTALGFYLPRVSKMLYLGFESIILWISSFSCLRPNGSHTYLSQTRSWSLLSDSMPL